MTTMKEFHERVTSDTRMIKSHNLELQKAQTFIAHSKNSAARQGEGGHQWKKITSEACQTHPTTQLLATGLQQQTEHTAADGRKRQETVKRIQVPAEMREKW